MQMNKSRFIRGYRQSLSQKEYSNFLKNFVKKSVYKGVSLTFFYLISIYLFSFIAFLTVYYGLSSSVIAISLSLSLLLSVRQMRALENVVHFGSHSNFTSNKKFNDFLVNILAAWPMLSDVKTYRKFHNHHHSYYGSEGDPCYLRFERMGLLNIDLSTRTKLALAVFRWLPSYIREYYRDVGSKGRQLTSFFTWHSIIMCLFFFISPGYTATLAIVWFLSMFAILPVIRSIAEASEHDYARGKSEISTTFNNIGIIDRWFLHPAGDAWHMLHHLFPTIPWWKQKNAHTYLMLNDPEYRKGLHRTSIIKKN